MTDSYPYEKQAAKGGMLYRRKVIGDARGKLLRRVLNATGDWEAYLDGLTDEQLAELGLKPTSAKRSKSRKLFGKYPLGDS